MIYDVAISCGCNTPVWTQQTVKSGSNAEVVVSYDAKYPDEFHKIISVFANVEHRPLEVTITEEVDFNEEALN